MVIFRWLVLSLLMALHHEVVGIGWQNHSHLERHAFTLPHRRLEVDRDSFDCSIQCLSNQGYFFPQRHRAVSMALHAMPKAALTSGEEGLRLTHTADDWMTMQHIASGKYIRMIKPPLKPGWVLAVDLDEPTTDSYFRVEVEPRGGSHSFFLVSHATGGYVNCLPDGNLRGHGHFPFHTQAATREPSTELYITKLDLPVPDGPPAKPSAFSFVAPATQPLRGKAFQPPERPKVCKTSCSTDFSLSKGYPGVAFKGEVGEYICPSTFRDMADYVVRWPFSHFKEHVRVAAAKAAAQCLPQVPIIYTQSSRTLKELFAFTNQLKRPYILITGQSDISSSQMKIMSRDRHLVLWFAQNNDIRDNPRVVHLPIGLNCFEHAPEMHQTLRLLGDVTTLKRPHWVLVNFGNTHSSRRTVWDQFCGSGKERFAKYATCTIKSQQNNIMHNPHLVSYYQKVATHKFVVSPRGNGWDTHRLWEALYLGCVPIVQTSPLDPLYHNLPIWIISNWREVTTDTLQSKYKDFAPMLKDRSYLTRDFWWKRIEATRRNILAKVSPESPVNGSRSRCWE